MADVSHNISSSSSSSLSSTPNTQTQTQVCTRAYTHARSSHDTAIDGRESQIVRITRKRARDMLVKLERIIWLAISHDKTLADTVYHLRNLSCGIFDEIVDTPLLLLPMPITFDALSEFDTTSTQWTTAVQEPRQSVHTLSCSPTKYGDKWDYSSKIDQGMDYHSDNRPVIHSARELSQIITLNLSAVKRHKLMRPCTSTVNIVIKRRSHNVSPKFSLPDYRGSRSIHLRTEDVYGGDDSPEPISPLSH